MTGRPAGWETARLADVAEVRLGRQRSPKRATGNRMRPYLRAANVTWRGLDLTDVKEMDFNAPESDSYELQPGDLLLSEASGSPGEVGKPAQYAGEIDGCCFQNTLLRVRLPGGLRPEFYEHFFREQALNGRFAEGSRGVGIHHLGAAALSAWHVPIPPEAEQTRIVTAIEEAFSKLDAGETGLRSVRRRLKRMREAVLAAAVAGRLVPQDPADLPAADLLKALGVGPLVGDGLPCGWSTLAIKDLGRVGSGTTPSRSRGDYWSDGQIPWVTSALLNEGIVRQAREFVTPRAVTETSLRLWPAGTLLVAMYGEGQTRGRCAELAIDATCNQACAAIDVRTELNAYRPFIRLSFYANYEANRRLASGGVQPNLNVGLIKSLPIPIPPVEEVQRIVKEVGRQLSFIEAAERAVEAALARCIALRRSVLKSGFAGRLVPQDSTDEPAAVLLQRIRDGQTANGESRARRRAWKVETS